MVASWEAEGKVAGSIEVFKEGMLSWDCETCSYACGCESKNETCDLSASGWCKIINILRKLKKQTIIVIGGLDRRNIKGVEIHFLKNLKKINLFFKKNKHISQPCKLRREV